MNITDHKLLNDFLQRFPRHEIVEILTNIDQKIISLHSISSKDFLYFNKLLKQYYSNIKEISAANNAISVFFNTDLLEIKEEIKEKNTTQIEMLNEINVQVSKIQKTLASIYSSFDMLVVPVNNYKQNLITLKYILANLKLHLNYIELDNAPKLQQSITSIEANITRTQNEIDVITLRTELVTKQIIYIKNEACFCDSTDNSDLKEELKKVSNSFKRISFDDYLPDNFVIALNNHTQKCFSYMGEVITNIQYHDIIRQKMEHIQISQTELIKEINSINDEQNTDNQIKLIVKIPTITDLQVAQLLYTNKDYQTSIEKITSQLLEVGNEMKALSQLYEAINENSNKFEDSFVNQVVVVQNVFKNYLDKLSSNWTNTNTEVTKLTEEYCNLKNAYNQIFQSEKALRREVQSFESQIKANKQNFGSDFMNQLNNLFSDLQTNSNSLKTQLNNITQSLNTLIGIININKPKNKQHFIGDESINNLTNKANQIKLNTKEYSTLSTNISNEIALSLKKIEYYAYFKNTVEEIVTLLSSINQIVNYDSLKNVLGENNDYLEKIKNLYTMESERNIHNKLVNSGKKAFDLLTEKDESAYNLDDNDIELF